jgi:hypothetical protein
MPMPNISRGRVEVHVGRQRPGDRRLEAVLASGARDRVDEALDRLVGIVGESEGHGRRVAIGRDERLVAVGVVAGRRLGAERGCLRE